MCDSITLPNLILYRSTFISRYLRVKLIITLRGNIIAANLAIAFMMFTRWRRPGFIITECSKCGESAQTVFEVTVIGMSSPCENNN